MNRQVIKRTGARMHPWLSSSRTKAGNRFLLHLETNGSLRCVAAEINDDASSQIIDGVSKCTISSEDFQRMCKEACDRKYILFCFVDCLPETALTDAEEKEYDLLLETQAAAESDHPDIFLFLTHMLLYQ